MRDYAAFADAYASHRPAVWAYLRRLGAGPELATDLAQDSFLRWLELPPDHGDIAHPRAWLYTTASRLYVDHRRRLGREVDWESQGAEPVIEEDREAKIPVAVWSVLSARQRQLLWLAYAEGFDHEEIARIAGVAASSVRVLLARARARLAELLAPPEGERT
ncbi:RNA polymerase sigma factor [Arenimonas sp.]|uniref:RNA polymerase sigma factor n=1 Tax=Arenimonas sp. TaxID=1872635 RepID=UPI0039E34FA9